ncbi:MAG: SRPBCC family protein [Vicinamibacterales bacterium]
MLRTAILVAGALGILVLIVVAFGYALPVGHVASVDRAFGQPPARVFAVIHDVERYPAWRSDVKQVQIVERTPALRWREVGSNGTITFEVQEAVNPSRLVTRIADRSLPFGGTWMFVLTPEGSGTRVAITEHGEVYNPIFRVMSRFVFGHAATMETFLGDLSTYLGRAANQ